MEASRWGLAEGSAPHQAPKPGEAFRMRVLLDQQVELAPGLGEVA